MTSSCEPTGPRHHGGCRSADARSSVTTMPTLQLLKICTTVRNNAGDMSAGRQTVSFYYCWWARLFTSKVHHPGNVIMMAVNGLAPKRHQYISKHHREFNSCIFQFTQTMLHNVHTALQPLTHWGRATHICVGKVTIIGSDNGLSPDRRQAIIWTNAGLFSIGSCEHISVKIQSKYHNFHWRKCTWKCRLRNGVHIVSASMLKAVRWVGNPHVPLLSAGSSSHTEHAPCTQYWTIHSW